MAKKKRKARKVGAQGFGPGVEIDDPTPNQLITLPFTADGYLTPDPGYTISGAYAQVDGGAAQPMTWDSTNYWTYTIQNLVGGLHCLMVCMTEYQPGTPSSPPSMKSYSNSVNFSV